MQHHLPVAVHVARREAGRAMARTLEGMKAFSDFQDALVMDTTARFVSGRRLDGAALADFTLAGAKALAALAPTTQKALLCPATRTRPKAEANEILAIAAFHADTEGGEARSLMALRVYIDRKRCRVDQEHLGIGFTRHMMERAMEREMVSRTGAFHDLEVGLSGYQGFLAAWRRARTLGLVARDHNLHLPFAGGLVLGQMRLSSVGAHGHTTYVGRDVSVEGHVSPNRFRTEDYGPTGGIHLSEWVGRTAVDEEVMSIQQLDYRDAAAAFSERHAGLFDRIAADGCWTEATLNPILSHDEVSEALDGAARDIARIVTAPCFQRVYQDRSGKESNPMFRALAA